LRATRPEEVETVTGLKGLAIEGPVIMDFVVESEECVYPDGAGRQTDYGHAAGLNCH
jgi:hypothetical protein